MFTLASLSTIVLQKYLTRLCMHTVAITDRAGAMGMATGHIRHIYTVGALSPLKVSAKNLNICIIHHS